MKTSIPKKIVLKLDNDGDIVFIAINFESGVGSIKRVRPGDDRDEKLKQAVYSIINNRSDEVLTFKQVDIKDLNLVQAEGQY